MARLDDLPILDPTRRNVAILANPSAGRRGSRVQVAELESALQQQGLVPIVCWERETLSCVAEEQRRELRCIVAAGGDGTLGEVLNRARGVPVTILPLGNENLVARYFGIRTSTAQVALMVAAGHVRPIDLIRVEDRLASLMVGVGFDAEVVHQVHRRRQGNISRLNYVGPILRALRFYAFPQSEIEIEDTGERLGGAMVFVFNLPCYGMRLSIAPQARGDDGLLDLYVFQQPGRWNLGRYAWAVLSSRQDELPDYQHRRARRLRLWSDQAVPVQADGDPAGLLPITIEVVPAALRLIVPPDVVV